MTDEVFTPERRGLAAWLSDAMSGPRDMARSALREAMNWSFYKWTVLALLTAIFLLVALSYGGIRAELAALKQEQPDPATGHAETGKRITDLEAALSQAISELKSSLGGDIAKIGAKLDARSQPKAPTPKPTPKPRPQ